MTAFNEHEQAARTAKVIRLVAALRDRLPDATDLERARVAERASDKLWADLALLAGCRPPSPVTQRLVVRVLATAGAADDGDLFAGL